MFDSETRQAADLRPHVQPRSFCRGHDVRWSLSMKVITTMHPFHEFKSQNPDKSRFSLQNSVVWSNHSLRNHPLDLATEAFTESTDFETICLFIFYLGHNVVCINEREENHQYVFQYATVLAFDWNLLF